MPPNKERKNEKIIVLITALVPTIAQAGVYMLNGGLECRATKAQTVDYAFAETGRKWPGEISVLAYPTTVMGDKNGMDGRYAIMNACLNGKCSVFVFTNSWKQCKSFEQDARSVAASVAQGR